MTSIASYLEIATAHQEEDDAHHDFFYVVSCKTPQEILIETVIG